MNLVPDLDKFFADFGVSAVVSETGKADKTITVLFDRNSLSDIGVITDKPQTTIKESDLAGVDIEGATIAVAGETWRLIKPLPDGTGLIISGLKRT